MENTNTPATTPEELEMLDVPALFYEETEGSTPPVFSITDDGLADWAVQKIAEEKAEYERLKQLADAQITAIKEKVAAAQKRYENGTAFLTSKLSQYFETVPHKKTKTQETYRLLSGTLKKKLGGTTMKQDDAKLLEYLKASGNEDLIKVEETPRWGEFKKRLEIVGGQVVDSTTGEIVEGVQLVENPDTFTVDV